MSAATLCGSAAGGGSFPSCCRVSVQPAPSESLTPGWMYRTQTLHYGKLCQLDTRSFSFLELWSGFAVVQKLFSQHSFPARQRSSYRDPGWSVKTDRNCTFALIWKLYAPLFVFPQGGKCLKIHSEEPPSSAVPISDFECCTGPTSVRQSRVKELQLELLPHRLPSSPQ